MSKYIDRDALFEAVRDKSMTQFDWSEKVDLEEFEEVLNSIPSAEVEAKKKWTPVTERLPERFTHIIVCDENGMVGEAYHFEGGRFEWLADEELAFATHWMPLPEPPENGATDTNAGDKSSWVFASLDEVIECYGKYPETEKRGVKDV